MHFWVPKSNLANLVIYGVFIKQSTFCHMNGHPNLVSNISYTVVDTIFNYRFHFELPLDQENVFRKVREMCVLRTYIKTFS